MRKDYRMPFPGWPIVLCIVCVLIGGLSQIMLGLFMGPASRPLVKTTSHANTQKQNAIGQSMLINYGKAGQSPQQDLTEIFRVLDSFSLLVKGDNPLPLGANEEIANALRGKNRTQIQFVTANAPCFNSIGQLIDRWGSPLFFHANDRQRIDIRSAGPDKEMWTQDDIHRRYDGQFLKNEALLAPSLFETTRDFRPSPARQ